MLRRAGHPSREKATTTARMMAVMPCHQGPPAMKGSAVAEQNRNNDFGKVAVVMGGWSSEREVSLMSGQAVFDALASAGIDVHPVDAGRDIARMLLAGGFERAFLILHGRGGEDGIVQAVLELAGIPYTGSGVLASALAMDKWRTKQFLQQCGIPTPVALLVDSPDDARRAADTIGYPVVVKPSTEGSSIGITMVDDAAGIDAAWELAACEPNASLALISRSALGEQ
ncbi:MAG: hypothetical protein CSA54_05345 [Gammaproteobacteria bacterium]|nr:MAG: hypothetical protein CSA54_05345 [Gammaproteobacteria bacterium]